MPPVAPMPQSRPSFMYIVGILGIIWTVLWVVLAIAMMASPSSAPTGPKQMDDGTAGAIVLVFMLIVFGLPSGLMFFFGRRARQRFDALAKVASLAATHSTLPLAQIAAEIGTTPERARAILLDGVSRRMIAGRLDAAAGVFVSATAAAGVQHTAVRCAACGAESTVVRAPGIPATCRYCGAPV